MATLDAHLLDACGAFLLGFFEDGERMFVEVPEGFEKHFKDDEVIELQKTIYGLKQSARACYRESVRAAKFLGYERNKIDPCVFFKWTDFGILLMCSWIDDYLIVGNRVDVLTAKKQFADVFECEDDGEMKEHVGCKITRTKNSVIITQPVLVQSLKDEFELHGGNPVTPLPAGLMCQKGNQDELINKEQQKTFRSAVGKLIHMTRWSRPMELNPVREVSRLAQGAAMTQHDGVPRIMQHVVNTPERG